MKSIEDAGSSENYSWLSVPRKWDQFHENRLTRDDFYDVLMTPREAFLIPASKSYPNVYSMLDEMNEVERQKRRTSRRGEWKIRHHDDGSRVVWLANQKGVIANPTGPGNPTQSLRKRAKNRQNKSTSGLRKQNEKHFDGNNSTPKKKTSTPTDLTNANQRRTLNGTSHPVSTGSERERNKSDLESETEDFVPYTTAEMDRIITNKRDFFRKIDEIEEQRFGYSRLKTKAERNVAKKKFTNLDFEILDNDAGGTRNVAKKNVRDLDFESLESELFKHFISAEEFHKKVLNFENEKDYFDKVFMKNETKFVNIGAKSEKNRNKTHSKREKTFKVHSDMLDDLKNNSIAFNKTKDRLKPTKHVTFSIKIDAKSPKITDISDESNTNNKTLPQSTKTLHNIKSAFKTPAQSPRIQKQLPKIATETISNSKSTRQKLLKKTNPVPRISKKESGAEDSDDSSSSSSSLSSSSSSEESSANHFRTFSAQESFSRHLPSPRLTDSDAGVVTPRLAQSPAIDDDGWFDAASREGPRRASDQQIQDYYGRGADNHRRRRAEALAARMSSIIKT